MMTNGGGLIPSIVDFSKEAKYLISAHDDPDYENWWSSETDGLTCYLQSTDPDEADRADCYVILEADSRDEIVGAFVRNCQMGVSYGYKKLKGQEETNALGGADCNHWWENSDWAKQQRENGKYLLGYPGNLDDLIPLSEEAAQILKRVARFHYEDHDPEYARIMGNCAKFL